MADPVVDGHPVALQIRDDAVVWSRLGEDIMVLDLPSSEYFRLNRSAAALWEKAAIESDFGRFDELVDTIVDRYGITRETAASDVRGFIDSLVAFGLIEA